MDPRTKWGIAGVVLGLAAAITLPSIAQTDPPSSEPDERTRTVTVGGTATVRSSPDEAVVSLGVRTEAASAEEAMADNADRMNAVIRSLLDQGLTEDDLATSSLSLYPRYADNGSTVVGFTAENQVTVTVRDLPRIGRLIDRAVEAGANLTSGISFRLSGDNDAADRALADAVADARGKAELIAAAADASLGQVLSVTESGSPTPPPIYDVYAAAGAEAATPVLPPELQTQVSVTVVWALV
ncbi:MAG TPA: SIMPL domain-containing protein [Actinomycetota bacterium]|nr:SIMPL domain-containing protein [Actinomycetota bacterium]